MRSPHTTLLATFALGAMAFGGTAMAEPDEGQARSQTDPSAVVADTPPVQARPVPIYRPARVGKPARTVGGGSRGPGVGVPALFVLVPDHVAQTASTQPSRLGFAPAISNPPKKRT